MKAELILFIAALATGPLPMASSTAAPPAATSAQLGAKAELQPRSRWNALRAATGVTSQLPNVMSALERRPDSIRDHEAVSAYSRGFDGAIGQHEKVNRAALVALNQTWWQRFQERRRLWKETRTRSE